jgi:predicted nucleic acid-binding protein
MKFWDASAIIPLLSTGRYTRFLQSLAARDPGIFVWWTTQTECVSALARLQREGALTQDEVGIGLKRLRQFAAGWHEIDPRDEVRETAARFLRVHPLRAADALQLAAAFVAAGGRPPSLDFVVLDERLATAAQKEGFATVEVGAGE